MKSKIRIELEDQRELDRQIFNTPFGYEGRSLDLAMAMFKLGFRVACRYKNEGIVSKMETNSEYEISIAKKL